MAGRLASRRDMNTRSGLVVVALALFALTGCSRSREAAPAPMANAPTAGGLTAGAPLAADRALVVTMNVGVTVDDVTAARETIRTEVERAGGYIADGSSYASGDDRSAHLELKVPSKEARGVHAALGRLGEITSDVEKVQDVTEERADLGARLANARASEKRVLEIMSTKAGTVADVLEAEKEVSRIRESIERMDAQKRALDGKVDFATVNVSLQSRPAPAAWRTPGRSIADAAKAGATAAKATAIYSAIAFAASAPFVLPTGLFIALLVIVMRRRRARLVPAS